MVAISIQRPDSVRRLDDAIELFESALQLDRTVDVRDFLPSGVGAEDRLIATELLCVDLHYRFHHGPLPTLDEYRSRFPQWLASPACLGELAREEYRLRLARAEPVALAEYSRRYNIDTSDWPKTPCDTSAPSTFTATVGETKLQDANRLETRLHDLQTQFDRLTAAITELPQPGDTVADCEIIEMLGRGALGVVYLAKQKDLAERQVVLKLTAAINHEPLQLARLQHTHIVPIYSLHCDEHWQTICMPYFGRTTLEDVLSGRRQLPATLDKHETAAPTPAQTPTATEPDSATIASAPAPAIALPEQAVLTIARQLAAALQHGHQRGIVHRDLKPANVLLSDDGAAMILDYNLSEDTIAGGAVCWQVGGTLPYMSPEHLAAVQTGAQVGTEADIYSLGVLLYQMLTGKLPFPSRRGPFDETIAASIRDRQRPYVSSTSLRPDASPALHSMIGKMLAASRTERYQSMMHVLEDLARHEAHQLLRYAPNSSGRERVAKWIKRHPRLTSAVGVGAIASILLAVTTAALVLNSQRLGHQHAVAGLRDLREELPMIRASLSLPGTDSVTRRDGFARVHRHVAQLTSLESPHGLKRTAIAGLSAAEVTELRGCLSECIALLDDPARSSLAHDNGDDTNELVARLSRNLNPEHRSQLSITAIRALQSRDFGTAARELEKLRDAQPYDVSLWLLLGNAYAGMQRFSEAEGCFTVCVTHWPNSHLGYFYRGLARMDQQNYDAARSDFTSALSRHDDLQAAYVNRAIAQRELQAWDKALQDLDTAIRLDGSQPRLFLIRSQVLRRLNRVKAAQQDRETALRLTPPDARNWLERGLSRLPDEPAAALRDFQQALTLEPDSWEAARNVALVHAEFQHQPAAALAVLNDLLRREPQRCADVVSRAVLHARMGNRELALADAKQAGQLQPSDKEVFQLACVYALTARQTKEDAITAIALLDEALRKNPDWLRIAEHDPDLNSLRPIADFKQILSECQARNVRRQASREVILTD